MPNGRFGITWTLKSEVGEWVCDHNYSIISLQLNLFFFKLVVLLRKGIVPSKA